MYLRLSLCTGVFVCVCELDSVNRMTSFSVNRMPRLLMLILDHTTINNKSTLKITCHRSSYKRCAPSPVTYLEHNTCTRARIASHHIIPSYYCSLTSRSCVLRPGAASAIYRVHCECGSQPAIALE